MESDLEIVVKDRDIILSPADIKSYMLMILRGVHTLHKNWILHRVRMFSWQHVVQGFIVLTLY